MKIASNPVLKNSEHVRNLPSDVATLYNIARIPAPQLEQYIEAD